MNNRYSKHLLCRYTRLLTLLAMLALFTSVTQKAYAIDCDSIFPGPVQSFLSAGSLYMQSGARIEGYDGYELCFDREDSRNQWEMSDLSCGTSRCEVTGDSSLQRDSVSFYSSSDNRGYEVASWTTTPVVLGETANYGSEKHGVWQAGYVTINGGVMSFSDDYDIYVLNGLTLYNSGQLILTAGKSYYIDGNVALSSGSITITGSGDTHLYIKGNLVTDNTSTMLGDSSLDVYVDGELLVRGTSQVQGSFYTKQDVTLQDNTVLIGRVSGKNVTMMGNAKVIYDDGETSPTLGCFTDDFSSSSLSDDWVVARSSGNFSPSIVNGRMRMTENVGNQATSATYLRLFPADGNYITIQFNQYAYGGNGADGIAFVLSDATITPQPGAFGGPLGYGFKSGIDGFTGGWIGVGIDEFGNFSNEGGSTNVGYRPQSVAIRGSGSGTSGYNYLHGACNDGSYWDGSGYCLDPQVDQNNGADYQYRMTLDARTSGKAYVKLERNTGDGYETLVDSFDVLAQSGQAALPENFLFSLTGSTGGSNNIHELDNFKICALSSSEITTVIDHFEIQYSGTPLTCEPLEMTIKACKDEACDELYTDEVTATLSPTDTTNGGWGGGNSVTFSGGSTTISLTHTEAGSVTVGVSGSEPLTKAFSETLCQSGSGSLSADACSINFADSGFVFDVPDKRAGKPVDVLIKAVKKDDTTQQCVTQFASTSKSINFWSGVVERPEISSYTPPAVTVNGSDIADSSSSPTSQTLSFNASGQATITVNYSDAGKLTLNASYIGSGDYAGLVMTGSDNFVSYPAGLCVAAVDSDAACTSEDASCSGYKAAGDSFNVNVRAKIWQSDSDTDICDNDDAPSFSMSSVTMAHSLIAPSGGNSGELSLTSFDQVAAVDGTTISESYSEVGVISLSASTTSSQTYLGSTAFSIPAYSSEAIGRFYPASFIADSVSVPESCGSFTYMAQPLYVTMTLKALNLSGVLTQNYQSSFASGAPVLVAENNNDGTDLSARLSAITGSWSAGQMVFSAASVTFDRAADATTDGPFSALALGVEVSDSDAVPMSLADMLVSSSDDCAANGDCSAQQLTSLDMRLGRAALANTYGPEDHAFLMSGEAQYWNGEQWQTNSDDSCSVVTPAMATQVSNSSLGYTFEPELSSGQSISRSGDPAALSSGSFGVQWLSSGTYRGKVTAPVTVPDWLQWYWKFDSSSALQDPRASAYFGRYRGNDRIINWREVR